MKKISALILAMFLVNAAQAQFEFRTAYVYSDPRQEMAADIKRGHGAFFEFAYRFREIPFSLGLQVNFSTYGYDKSRQVYSFDDGSTAETDVMVYNNFTNFQLTSRYFFFTQKSMLQPYIQAKMGLSRFYTNLTIDDPEDVDDCVPLEQDILQRDLTFVGTIGAGLQWDLSSVFKKTRKDFFYLDASVNYNTGGRVNYMNVDKPVPQENGQEVYGRFINTQTQVVHEHHVGYVYSSMLRMIDFRVGMVFRFRK